MFSLTTSLSHFSISLGKVKRSSLCSRGFENSSLSLMCFRVVLILNIFHTLIIMSRNSGIWDCELECVVLKIVRAAYVDVSNTFKAKVTFCL